MNYLMSSGSLELESRESTVTVCHLCRSSESRSIISTEMSWIKSVQLYSSYRLDYVVLILYCVIESSKALSFDNSANVTTGNLSERNYETEFRRHGTRLFSFQNIASKSYVLGEIFATSSRVMAVFHAKFAS
jgi:hypothetical protein